MTAAAALAVLAGCGDDGSPGFGGLSGEPEDASNDGGAGYDDQESAPVPDTGSGHGPDDAELVVDVSGTEYVVDADRGGHCDIDGATETGSQISVGGFDAESGTRVELALRHQIAETTVSGVDEYFGGLSVASSPVEWRTSSNEPWPFAVANPISATLTMEDDDGQLVEVAFEIDCS